MKFDYLLDSWNFTRTNFTRTVPKIVRSVNGPYISKAIQPMFQTFPSARRCWGWVFGWKFSDAQVFSFCNSKVKTLRIDNIWIFPLSTCRVCQLKSYISKTIQPIFENVASARRCWGWAFGWKVSGAQFFYFCNGKVRTLRIDNIWIFPLSTCRLFQLKFNISKGIHPIFENFPSARRWWGWAFGWNVSGAEAFCFHNGKVKTSRIDNFWNSHIQPVQCAGKNRISPKVFNRFSKTLLQLDEVEGEHLGGKFQTRRYFTFAMARWKLCASTTFDISHFQPVQCARKNHISPKVFYRFSKTLL